MDSAPVMVCRRFKPPGVQVVDRDWSRTVDLLVSCDLVETELRRIAVREGIDQGVVTWILDGVGLAALDRAVYRDPAGRHGEVCSLAGDFPQCATSPRVGEKLSERNRRNYHEQLGKHLGRRLEVVERGLP